VLQPGERVVAVLTGSALKAADALRELLQAGSTEQAVP
jgi:threonine synthase